MMAARIETISATSEGIGMSGCPSS